ncbi:MAG: cation:dicarboxylase symporter family transporter [Alphaproteobacteria bacterium]|nr:cation:dicarboxylase symporter family transporter [Alphaproteobacteria bacterium]
MTNKLRKIIFNPLIQLICAMIVCSCCYSTLSTDTIRFFLTISVCLRETLVFVLPFLLFSFIAVALSAIPKEGMLFVLGLMVVVFISNFTNIMVSGLVGFGMLSGSHSKDIIENSANFVPFFEPQLPIIASTSHALFFGVLIGFLNSFYPNKYVTYIIKTLHSWVMIFMKRFFVPLLPLFVSGFLLKLFAEGRMTGFVAQNSAVYIKMFGFLFCYLLLWLAFAASFKRDRMIEILKNAFPAIITAFSTMSSAAALPLSLNAAEKNTKDKILADAVMPLTLNFHMVGDTIIVPILAMMVIITFNHPMPTTSEFIMFGVFFVLNKFAGGGVPSGTIMVTVPVLKQYLGFDDSMTAFIIALYGVIDPIATSGNVAANNFFVVIFQKIRKSVKKVAGITAKRVKKVQ